MSTELIGILGTLVMMYGTYSDLQIMTLLGLVIAFVYNSVQIIINIISRGECYLAAVHPITYLSLRNAKRIRIRKITSWCVCNDRHKCAGESVTIKSLKSKVRFSTRYLTTHSWSRNFSLIKRMRSVSVCLWFWFQDLRECPSLLV